MDILAEIKTQYETFGKARRQISDIILENPAKCCFLSLKEFAAAANTTEVTVLKYCRDLGISSFVELKSPCRAICSHGSHPLTVQSLLPARVLPRTT